MTDYEALNKRWKEFNKALKRKEPTKEEKLKDMKVCPHCHERAGRKYDMEQKRMVCKNCFK